MNEVRPFRQQYLAEHPVCPVTGKRADCLHEISDKFARDKSLDVRAAVIAMDGWANCHEMTDRVKWPIKAQYVLKAIQDPEGYNRVEVNLLRGRQPEAISEVDVVLAAYQLGVRDGGDGLNRLER